MRDDVTIVYSDYRRRNGCVYELYVSIYKEAYFDAECTKPVSYYAAKHMLEEADIVLIPHNRKYNPVSTVYSIGEYGGKYVLLNAEEPSSSSVIAYLVDDAPVPNPLELAAPLDCKSCPALLFYSQSGACLYYDEAKTEPVPAVVLGDAVLHHRVYVKYPNGTVYKLFNFKNSNFTPSMHICTGTINTGDYQIGYPEPGDEVVCVCTNGEIVTGTMALLSGDVESGNYSSGLRDASGYVYFTVDIETTADTGAKAYTLNLLSRAWYIARMSEDAMNAAFKRYDEFKYDFLMDDDDIAAKQMIVHDLNTTITLEEALRYDVRYVGADQSRRLNALNTITNRVDDWSLVEYVEPE